MQIFSRTCCLVRDHRLLRTASIYGRRRVGSHNSLGDFADCCNTMGCKKSCFCLARIFHWFSCVHMCKSHFNIQGKHLDDWRATNPNGTKWPWNEHGNGSLPFGLASIDLNKTNRHYSCSCRRLGVLLRCGDQLLEDWHGDGVGRRLLHDLGDFVQIETRERRLPASNGDPDVRCNIFLSRNNARSCDS